VVERAARAPVATFFAPERASVGAHLALDEDAAHHIRVRRLELGERVRVVDGAGGRAAGTLVRVAKAQAVVEVDEAEEVEPLPPVHVIVPIADRDRMLWLAEKCAELGATSWRPLMWRRSRSVSPRGEGPTFHGKVRARMAAALTQCGGAWLPDLFPEATVERAVAAAPAGTRILLDADAPPILSLDVRAPVTLAVGPEGGVEPEERAALVAAGFAPARLAGNILRFETAAVAGLAAVRAMLERDAGAPRESP
jgi:16S rRNA (uracil1498-N3)-methyltransferase